MKTAIHKIAVPAFIAFCAFLNASGQQPDSLAHYIEMASKNNPLILQKYHEYQAVLQKIPQAGSLPDPELSMGVFLSPMEILSGKQAADIRLMQMFPWFDVQRTWYELFKTSQNIRIAEKNREILKSVEQLTLTRFRTGGESGTGASNSPMNAGNTMQKNGSAQASSGMSGMTSTPAMNTSQPAPAMTGSSNMGVSATKPGLTDVIGVQIEMGDLENNIALLKNRFQTITARFNGYLNRPANTPVSMPDSIRPDTFDFQLWQVTDSMLAGNPMPEMWHYEQQSLAAREKMVSRMGFPVVGIGLNYSVIQKSNMSTSDMNGNDMIMPMVTVTLPVYRKKYKAMQNEAGMMQEAAGQGYQAAVNALQSEFYEAVQLYHDANRRMNLYANQIQLASQSFDIMTKSFSTSGTGLTDLLRYRQLLLEYENLQVEAIADYNTSVAWLKKLMAIAPLQESKVLDK